MREGGGIKHLYCRLEAGGGGSGGHNGMPILSTGRFAGPHPQEATTSQQDPTGSMHIFQGVSKRENCVNRYTDQGEHSKHANIPVVQKTAKESPRISK